MRDPLAAAHGRLAYAADSLEDAARRTAGFPPSAERFEVQRLLNAAMSALDEARTTLRQRVGV